VQPVGFVRTTDARRLQGRLAAPPLSRARATTTPIYWSSMWQ
jgi:hypothetical protein